MFSFEIQKVTLQIYCHQKNKICEIYCFLAVLVFQINHLCSITRNDQLANFQIAQFQFNYPCSITASVVSVFPRNNLFQFNYPCSITLLNLKLLRNVYVISIQLPLFYYLRAKLGRQSGKKFQFNYPCSITIIVRILTRLITHFNSTTLVLLPVKMKNIVAYKSLSYHLNFSKILL